MNNNPLIDILMATYNGERFVGKQIESIQSQSYTNWRLLVSDDCSTDGTLEILKQYARDDTRINIVSEGVRRGGAKENFACLMHFSNANYCMFCDQDDIWRVDKLEQELNALVKAEDTFGTSMPVMVHSDLELVDADAVSMNMRMSQSLDFSPQDLTLAQMFVSGFATGCTMAVNRACINKALECKSWTSVMMHDWWIALVSEIFGKRIYIDLPLVLYRQHGTNVVGAAVAPLKVTVRKYFNIFRLSGFNSMLNRIVTEEDDRIRQASYFYELYQDDLSSDQRLTIEAITSIPFSSVAGRLASLTKYGLWRRGYKRRFRQLLAMMLIGNTVG